MSCGRMTAAGGRLSFRRRFYVRGVPPEDPVPGADHLLLQPAKLCGHSARAESTLRNQRLRLHSQNKVAVSQLGSIAVFFVALSTSILSFPTPVLFVSIQGCAAAAAPCCGPDVAVVFAERFITGGQWEERRAVIGLHGHPPRPPLAGVQGVADTPPPGCPASTAPAGGGGPDRGGGRGGDRGGDGRRRAAQKPRGVAMAAAWEHGTWKIEDDLRSLRLSIERDCSVRSFYHFLLRTITFLKGYLGHTLFSIFL